MTSMMDRLAVCRVCANRKMDMKTGVVCGLTMAKPTFDGQCPTFTLDEKEAKHYIQRDAAVAESSPGDTGAFVAEKRGLEKGIFGGLAMMVIAVVWFVVGWQAGRIFFYPPVLFIVGLVGLIRGIAQGNVAGKRQ